MSQNASDPVPVDSDGTERIEAADAPSDWVLRIVNPVLTRLLRSPLHGVVSDRLMLLTVTGRRSGTQYTFPVLYERENEIVRVTSHGTTWWKNLHNGGQDVTVYLDGKRRTGAAEVEEDNRAVAEYARDYLQRHGPDAADRVGLDLPSDGIPTVETLETAVDHIVLVSIKLHDF